MSPEQGQQPTLFDCFQNARSIGRPTLASQQRRPVLAFGPAAKRQALTHDSNEACMGVERDNAVLRERDVNAQHPQDEFKPPIRTWTAGAAAERTNAQLQALHTWCGPSQRSWQLWQCHEFAFGNYHHRASKHCYVASSCSVSRCCVACLQQSSCGCNTVRMCNTSTQSERTQ